MVLIVAVYLLELGLILGFQDLRVVLDFVRRRAVPHHLAIQENFYAGAVEHPTTRSMLQDKVKWYLKRRSTVKEKNSVSCQDQGALRHFVIRAAKKKEKVRYWHS